MVAEKHQETLTFSLLNFRERKKHLPGELYCFVDKKLPQK